MNQYPEKHTGLAVHHLAYSRRERIVGLFVFTAFVLFLFFVIISIKNQHILERRAPFYIEVNSNEGINPGNTVQMLGAEIGQVSRLTPARQHKTQVTLEIYQSQRARIRVGAIARVNRLTHLGDALIEIRSDEIDAPLLPAGSTIEVEETPSLNDLLLGLANLIQAADKHNVLGKLEAILPQMEQTLTNLHKIIAQIASGKGTLGAAVFDHHIENDLKITVKAAASTLIRVESLLNTAEQRLQQLDPILDDGARMTQDLSEATPHLPKLMADLAETVTLIEQALLLVNAELRDLPGVGLETRKTLNRADRLLESVQHTWPLSTQWPNTATETIIPPQPSHD